MPRVFRCFGSSVFVSKKLKLFFVKKHIYIYIFFFCTAPCAGHPTDLFAVCFACIHLALASNHWLGNGQWWLVDKMSVMSVRVLLLGHSCEYSSACTLSESGVEKERCVHVFRVKNRWAT